MKFVLVAVESRTLEKKRVADRLKNYGDECHALGNVWVIRTEKPIENIYNDVKAECSDAGDRFIVAPLEGKWAAYNTKSPEECFEF
jgi:hypothetical protein